MPLLKSENSRSRDYVVLALIAFVAALLRFIGLTRDSFWTDETFSGYAAQLSSPGEVVKFISYDVHPPGYFLSLWAWGKVFGTSEYALRAFSAVGGILLILVAYRLGKQLFDSRTGLIAAFFSGFFIQGIYYSQEVRAYIWMALFSALSVSLLVDFIRAREDGKSAWKWLAGATLVCVLNAYFHYFGLLFSLLLFVGLFVHDLRGKKPVWHSMAGGFAVVLCFAPWVPTMLASTGKQNWIQKPGLKDVALTANILYGPGFLLVGIALLFLFFGFVAGRAKHKVDKRDLWLALWILVPLVIAVGVSLVQKRPIYSPRNMILAYVAGALLMARAISFFVDEPRHKWALSLWLVALMFGAHYVKGDGYLFRPVKQQVREAAQFVETHNTSRLPVYTIDFDRENFSYYFHDTEQMALMKNITEAEALKGLPSAIQEQEFWVASAGANVDELAKVDQDYEKVQAYNGELARAYLLRRKDSIRTP